MLVSTTEKVSGLFKVKEYLWSCIILSQQAHTLVTFNNVLNIIILILVRTVTQLVPYNIRVTVHFVLVHRKLKNELFSQNTRKRFHVWDRETIPTFLAIYNAVNGILELSISQQQVPYNNRLNSEMPHISWSRSLNCIA